MALQMYLFSGEAFWGKFLRTVESGDSSGMRMAEFEVYITYKVRQADVYLEEPVVKNNRRRIARIKDRCRENGDACELCFEKGSYYYIVTDRNDRPETQYADPCRGSRKTESPADPSDPIGSASWVKTKEHFDHTPEGILQTEEEWMKQNEPNVNTYEVTVQNHQEKQGKKSAIKLIYVIILGAVMVVGALARILRSNDQQE